MTEHEELKQLADECYAETLQYMHDSKYKLALETALRAKDIYVEINDRRNESAVSNLLSLIYEEMGNAVLELQSTLDALDIAIDENAYDLSAKLYNNLGSKFLFNKSYERALFYFRNAIAMSKKAEEADLYTDTARNEVKLVVGMNIATTYCLLDNFTDAQKYYEYTKYIASKGLSDDLDFSYIVFEALYFKRSGDIEKATQLIQPIIERIETNPYTTDYLEVLLDVIELLKDLGEIALWEKVLMLMDSHLDEDASIYSRLELLNQWLIFYQENGKEAEYSKACIKYYQLSLEKNKQDIERESNTLELNAEMRRAIRQKKKTDSIVYLDTLTGIGNRNKMLLDSKAMIEESYVNGTTIAIGLLDIDFFKESNDTYGHIEGDICLRSVAHIIQEVVGANGNVYRYGGDEFLILMKTNDVDLINHVGKRIKDKLKEAKLNNEKSPICPYVTISQGYTSAKAEKDDTIDTLVRFADRVLYSVKRNGRNNYKYMTLDKILADM